jgi:hypothetical protein
MFLFLAALLGIAWLLSFTVFKATTMAVHFLMVFAVVSLVVHFVREGRRATL